LVDVRFENAMRTVNAALSRAVSSYEPRVLVREEGRVLSVADGVVRVEGLPGAALEEVIEIDGRIRALVLSLDRSEIHAIALDDARAIFEGSTARSTGRVAVIPAGEALLGRVVDPLGRSLDGAPIKGTLSPMPLERRAPHIHERAAVHSPLYTGILAIDAMFPIGRGQRELIVGEEGTGKTSLALDVLLRQKNTGVVCVYVAIGRRRAETWQIVESLRKGGGQWVVVFAPEDASPGMRYLAPYAGCAVAEYFAYRGEHALVIYDELTSHAVAWRELSLLLRRPPGREAYPGDIFYLHSRLLERAAQLSVEKGGGSLTALPIAMIEAGRLTAYIPTNLISITDGQIVLSQSLFAAGQKPAIDAGLSVSRVGSKAQPAALRELAGKLRLDYSAFLELETFSRLGTRLEAATAERLELGRRTRALLRARRFEPLGVFDEVVRLVFAEAHDLLVRVPEDEVESVALGALERLRRTSPIMIDRIERDAVLTGADRHVIVDTLASLIDARFREPEDASGSG